MNGRGARVCFVVPTFPRRAGGGARTFYEHANSLARRGYDVSVLHSLNRRSSPGAWLIDTTRGKFQDLRTGSLRRRVTWLGIDRRVRMLCVDRLDASTRLPGADLRIGTFWTTTEFLANRGDGVPVLQLLQAYETWAGPVARVDAVWRLPTHAVVVSTALRARGRELGIPDDRLHLVPNGLDHAVFRPIVALENRPPCITFPASAAPVKGLADAVDVVGRVHRTRPDVSIVAFGVERRMPELPEYVTYVRGLSGPDLAARIYNRAAVLLCPSRSEGWGFPSIEAMACGTALVSTRNGGVDDFAEHERSALLCDVGDTAGLANAVCTLLADEPRRREIAEEGMRSAARFSWEASGSAFDRAVRAALEAPPLGSV